MGRALAGPQCWLCPRLLPKGEERKGRCSSTRWPTCIAYHSAKITTCPSSENPGYAHELLHCFYFCHVAVCAYWTSASVLFRFLLLTIVGLSSLFRFAVLCYFCVELVHVGRWSLLPVYYDGNAEWCCEMLIHSYPWYQRLFLLMISKKW